MWLVMGMFGMQESRLALQIDHRLPDTFSSISHWLKPLCLYMSNILTDPFVDKTMPKNYSFSSPLRLVQDMLLHFSPKQIHVADNYITINTY